MNLHLRFGFAPKFYSVISQRVNIAWRRYTKSDRIFVAVAVDTISSDLFPNRFVKQ